MIRLSLIYLIIAVFIGGTLLVHKVVPIHPAIWSLLPVHYEMAIWGWIVQFVMGTAYWIFPRFMVGPARGHETTAWVMAGCLNTGILLLILSIFIGSDPDLRLTARFLMILSVSLFGILVWGRVITYRNKR
jgi:hypothetical protein